MAALTRALRTLTSCQVETCPVVCADQQAIFREKEPAGSQVQIAAFVGTDIAICRYAVTPSEKHHEMRAVRAVDPDFPAVAGNIADQTYGLGY